jgi:F-type H+-transporting ATPase subunit a
VRSILARPSAVDSPGGVQHVVEVLNNFVDNQSHEIIGHEYKHYMPYIMTIALFILACNLIGLIPSLESPTASPVVPLGCALTTFFYYNFHGIRHHGWHYVRQFLGPSPAIAWLMLPIELVSHLARIMSLTVRLYANIYAGDMVTLAFFSLIPVLVPVIFLGLHLMVALVQTFIFATLTMVYLGMALSEEH